MAEYVSICPDDHLNYRFQTRARTRAECALRRRLHWNRFPFDANAMNATGLCRRKKRKTHTALGAQQIDHSLLRDTAPHPLWVSLISCLMMSLLLLLFFMLINTYHSRIREWLTSTIRSPSVLHAVLVLRCSLSSVLLLIFWRSRSQMHFTILQSQTQWKYEYYEQNVRILLILLSSINFYWVCFNVYISLFIPTTKKSHLLETAFLTRYWEWTPFNLYVNKLVFMSRT